MDKDQEIKELKTALQEALTTIAQLNQQVQELQARLAKDSHNSHLPPSSDRFARQPKSLRKKSEKPSGGQAGHQGHHQLFHSQSREEADRGHRPRRHEALPLRPRLGQRAASFWR